MKQKYSRELMPPNIKKDRPFVNLFNFRNDPIKFFNHITNYDQKISTFHLGSQRIMAVNEPEYIKEILLTQHTKFRKGRGLQMAKVLLGEGLLTSEGKFHKRQRRLIQPAFHHHRINYYGQIMIDSALTHCQSWPQNKPIDMADNMMALTLDIVTKALFDTAINSETQKMKEALTIVVALFHKLTNPLTYILEKFNYSWLFNNPKAANAYHFLNELISEIIQKRRDDPELHKRHDLLSLLIQAEDSESDGERMSNRQVKDESITLFLAGHETTANALTWTLYLLSQHPEIERKFLQELDDVLGKDPPTVEKMKQLTYTRQIFMESLRLYPPAWLIGRMPIEDYILDGFFIPNDTILMMCQYTLHRNPKYFNSAEQFRPERWSDELKSSLPKFAYFPFGGGPRVCIGEHFAWMEGILLLAVIGQQWRCKLAENHSVKLNPVITLRPKNGMKMILTPR